jgi:DNA polymerase III sliding clamp (beta) subunit (PCNA family)
MEQNIPDCFLDIPEICVLLRPFLAFVESSQGDEVGLMTTKNNRLSLMADGTVVEIASLPGKEFPAEPKDSFKAIGVIAGDIADGIRAASWACDKHNISLPLREALHCFSNGTSVKCEGYDGKRFAQFSRASIAAPFDFLIPNKFAPLLADYLSIDGAILRLGENYLSVEWSGGRIYSALAHGNYFDTSEALKTEADKIGDVDIDELRTSTELCLASGKDFAPIKFSFSAQGLKLSCQLDSFGLDRDIPGNFQKFDMMADAVVLLLFLKNIKTKTAPISRGINRGFGMRSGDLFAAVAGLNPEALEAPQ